MKRQRRDHATPPPGRLNFNESGCPMSFQLRAGGVRSRLRELRDAQALHAAGIIPADDLERARDWWAANPEGIY